MAFLIKLRVVAESELDGAAEHGLAVDVAVGFCHNLAVDATGGTTGRGTVILYGFFHDLDLLGREPFLQTGISHQDLSPPDVVVGTVAAHA